MHTYVHTHTAQAVKLGAVAANVLNHQQMFLLVDRMAYLVEWQLRLKRS
jgi:hypothetical protein